MSSTNAIRLNEGVERWTDAQQEPVETIERPLIGGIFRHGTPALELAVLNGVTAADFYDSGCSELFEIARQSCLENRSLTLAAVQDQILGQGLQNAAIAALEQSSTVALSQIPLLSRELATDSVYRGMMTTINQFHMGAETTMKGGGGPADLLRVYETYKFEMRRLERRLTLL